MLFDERAIDGVPDPLGAQQELHALAYGPVTAGRLHHHVRDRPDVGDDLLDLPALQRAGLAVTVADAVADVKAVAHVVTKAAGGHGAVRECVELLLRAHGVWDTVYRAFVEEHGGKVPGPG